MSKPTRIPRNFSWLRFLRNFILLSLSFVLLAVVISSIYIRLNYDKKPIEQKNCAVVFGAAVWRDDIPSHALSDRTMSGINLYKNKKVNCLIFSGGKSKYGSHEADVMKKIALENNIPSEKIFTDYTGNSTYETIKNVQQNFAEKSVIFVSNDFHLARIKLIAWKLGVKDFALQKANYQKGEYAKKSYFFFREILGVLYYSVFLW